MDLKRRNLLAYGLLVFFWLLVVAWQAEEHLQVREAARNDLTQSSEAIASTVGAFIRGLQWHGRVFRERLEPVLSELANGPTNQLVKSGEILSIALLNSSGDVLASAGNPMDWRQYYSQKEFALQGERWGSNNVILVYPIEGASVLPSFHELTNAMPETFRGREFPPRRGPRPERPPDPPPAGPGPGAERPARTNATERGDRFRNRGNRPRRPFWARRMPENAYEALIKTRELHGLAIAMSTGKLDATVRQDLWLRCIISFFASISAFGFGVAWRNLAKSSELQIRLVRASELNTHLREMNLAAAGLAHETRNPLNIIRGLAQMISRRPDTPTEVRNKSRDIINEADIVTAQLNEFINYSRPRELRSVVLGLNPVLNEVVRALNYDIEENKIEVRITGDALSIVADEQMLRQALFNLVLNAIQAVGEKGEIEIAVQRQPPSEASIEVRDNGPGVPPERRGEIFKPYFTTQQKGTGLGLAIVHQIVLAHGWEIECLSNDPRGAIFRITHLKVPGRRQNSVTTS